MSGWRVVVQCILLSAALVAAACFGASAQGLADQSGPRSGQSSGGAPPASSSGVGALGRGYDRCRDVIIRNQDGSVYTRTNGLFVLKTSCRVGRAVAHKYLADDGVRGGKTLGFKCRGGSDGVACEKSRKRVTWGYYFDRQDTRS